MTTAPLPHASLPAIHRQFLAALPQIETTIRYFFRRWPRRLRAEAIADATSASWHAWRGLLARGQDPMDVGPTGIANNACRYVKSGRRLGTGTARRGALDILDPKAQRK